MELDWLMVLVGRKGGQMGYNYSSFSQTCAGNLGAASVTSVPYPPLSGGGLIEALYEK